MLNQLITSLFENYIDDMTKASAEDAKHLGALSRMFVGKRGKSDELLPVFDKKLEELLTALYTDKTDSSEIRELADYMLSQVSDSRDEPMLKYSFLAVQRHLFPFIVCLSSEDAAFLRQRFEAVIPRQERFPVQMDLIKKLKEQARK